KGRVQYRLSSDGGFYCSISSQIETPDEGTHILATVDGIQRTMSEASLRRNLKLRDEDGIVSIPDTELFENLTLMGQYSRRVRIAQSSALPIVADEPASPVRDVSEEEACPTESGFVADQDRATIAKSSTLPHDPAPRVTSLAADEGSSRRGNCSVEGKGDNYTKVYKFQSQQRRTMTKKQKREYYMAMIRNNLGCKVKDFKGLSFEEIEAKFAEVWKQVEDFIPMGSKEETKRLKRKGLNLEQEQVKKQKSSEEAPEIETSTEDFTEEKIKKMIQLVHVEDVYVQALQVKHPIID
nr:hypothetical protein [Tanacetum cinerariifolium]